MVFKPGQPKIAGRKAGTPNKHTQQLKEAILSAAENAGWRRYLVAYLTEQAIDNPTAFMSLLGKLLPLQTKSDRDNPRRHHLGHLPHRRPKEQDQGPSSPRRSTADRSGDGQITDAQRDRDRALALPRQAQGRFAWLTPQAPVLFILAGGQSAC